MSPRKENRSGKLSRGKRIGAQNSVEPTAEQLVEIERQYESVLIRNETLLDEVTFILSERLNSSGIKVHAVEKRIKTLSSVLGKCRSKGIRNFSGLKDIVGS